MIHFNLRHLPPSFCIVILAFASQLRPAEGLRVLSLSSPTHISLQSGMIGDLLKGKNMSAVVVNATEISGNTIQVIFEANISKVDAKISNDSQVQTGKRSVSSTMTGVTAVPVDKVLLQVDYGAVDAFSMAFLTNVLSPAFANLSEYTTLRLAPFGRSVEINVSSLTDGFLFWHPELNSSNISHVYRFPEYPFCFVLHRCPHGEAECEVSLMHACSVKAAKNDPRVYLPFLACMGANLTDVSPEDTSFRCGKNLTEVDSSTFLADLRACALGREGLDLQHALLRSQEPGVLLPIVSIDGKRVEVDKMDAKGLIDALCKVGTLRKLPGASKCAETGAAPTASTTIVAPFESLLTTPSGGGGAVSPTATPATTSTSSVLAVAPATTTAPAKKV